MKGKEARLADYAKDTWEALVQERRIDFLKDNSGHLVAAPYMAKFDGFRTANSKCMPESAYWWW